MKLTVNYITSTLAIQFTCAQCGHEGSSPRWFMTCPRCWVPMMPGSRETWWPRCSANG